MKNQNFTAGQEVYNIHGQAAEYIAKNGGFHVVRILYENEDGEPYRGEVTEWEHCFSNSGEAEAKLSKSILDLDEELREKQAKLHSLNEQIQSASRGETERMARLKQHEALARLDDFLSGEITHYVAKHEYYETYEVIPFDKTERDYYGRSDKYRLLSLIPVKNWRSIQWVLNEYHDGSGKDTKVWPCKSEEEAIAKTKELLIADIERKVSQEPQRRYYMQEFIDCCAKFGVEVPAVLIDDHRRLKAEALNSQIEKNRAEIAKLQAAVQNV